MAVNRYIFASAIALTLAPFAAAQPPGGFNIRSAPPAINVHDKEDVWILELKFKDPRVITVDIPGRGRTAVWYMWYQVINRTSQPLYFRPMFELVTLDKNTIHQDEVLPGVQEAVRKIEDPTGFFKIKNSVSIGEQPIPPTKPDSDPVAVTGVALFTDVATRAAATTKFSIFVSGLSNGWTVDDAGTIRRKTLQMNFRRPSDERQTDASIQFVAPVTWMYRATNLKVEGGGVPVTEEKKDEKKEEK